MHTFLRRHEEGKYALFSDPGKLLFTRAKEKDVSGGERDGAPGGEKSGAGRAVKEAATVTAAAAAAAVQEEGLGGGKGGGGGEGGGGEGSEGEKKERRPPVKSSSKAMELLGGEGNKGKKEKGQQQQQRQRQQQAREEEEEEQAFFCSELVAECLQQMKVLKDERTASYFWPVNFSKDGILEKHLCDGISIEDSVIIDPRAVEVGNAHTILTKEERKEREKRKREKWRASYNRA